MWWLFFCYLRVDCIAAYICSHYYIILELWHICISSAILFASASISFSFITVYELCIIRDCLWYCCFFFVFVLDCYNCNRLMDSSCQPEALLCRIGSLRPNECEFKQPLINYSAYELVFSKVDRINSSRSEVLSLKNIFFLCVSGFKVLGFRIVANSKDEFRESNIQKHERWNFG